MKSLSCVLLLITAIAVYCQTVLGDVTVQPQVAANVTKVTQTPEQTQNITFVPTQKPEIVPDLSQKSGLPENTDQPDQTTVQTDADATVNAAEESTMLPPSLEEDYNFEDLDIENGTVDHFIDGRIVGGVAAAAGDFPFAVFVSGGANFRSCTGVLVSSFYALVPASCVAGLITSIVTVRVGAIAQGAGGTAMNILRIIPHPKYRYSPEDYNIALLRLSTAVVTASASPISLATKSTSDDDKDVAGQTFTVVGYGPTTSTGAGTALLYTDLTVLSKAECLRRIRPYSGITVSSKQSCLNVLETVGLCGQADLGSMVLRRFGSLAGSYTLVGIVTYIHDCATTVPAMFIRVTMFYDWINKYINNPQNYGS